ncbi:virulence factor MviN [Pseudactinotalea sp. HY160]|uniref:murein biosynthesis integral membrane protein MurJ n=1 Tax=Pseudactinotalea sp. HY160 TaxID=2654490 RepID=UPI0013104F7F|nr:virulence factor MviN [Pseudactinotalea sp. HY160]
MSRARLLGGVAGAATLIAALTIVSRILGFGRWFTQAGVLGASAVGNAYASANTIPNVLYEVVAGGALAGAVIPLLAGPLAKRLTGDVQAIASALLTWALAGLVPVGIALAVFARPIAELMPMSKGSDPAADLAQVELATTFLIVFSPQVVLYGIGVVLTGLLQAHKRFLAPVLAPIASTAVVVTSYLVFGALADGLQDEPGRLSDASLAWLAWGTTAGVAAMSLPLLVPVFRLGIRFRPTLRFPPGVARRARSLAFAGIGSLIAQQASVLAVVWLARGYGLVGTINVFQYSQAVYFLPYAVLAVPFATAVFPRIAELAELSGRTDRTARSTAIDGGGSGPDEGDHDRDFAAAIASSTRTVVVAALIGVAALIAVAPAVQSVFELMDPMPGMSAGLAWMAPGLVGYSLIFHISRVLYSADRNRLAVGATALGWAAVVAGCIVFVRLIAGDRGDQEGTLIALGLGHSVGMSVAAAALLWALTRIGDGVRLAGILRTLVTGLAAAAAAAVAGRWIVDALLAALGTSVAPALLSGLLGGTVCIIVVVGVVFLTDRELLNVIRRPRGSARPQQ